MVEFTASIIVSDPSEIGIHVTAFAPSVVSIWFGTPGVSIFAGVMELLATSNSFPLVPFPTMVT